MPIIVNRVQKLNASILITIKTLIMKNLIAVLSILAISIVSLGQNLPKDFKRTVENEYNQIQKETHPDFKLTFDQYYKLRSEEYLADQKFYISLKTKSANDLCSNGDFEDGLDINDWNYFWGGGYYDVNNSSYQSGFNCISTGSFGPCSGSHTHSTQVQHQVQNAGNDEIVGSLLNKVFNYPTGNTKSLRLGNAETQYGKSRIVKNNVLITATNSLFSFSYALVMHNPVDHPEADKPYFKVEITDVNSGANYSNLINLGGGSNILVSNHPSLISSGIYKCGIGSNYLIVYKPWACYTFDLSSIIGKTVNIIFEVRDCNQGAHFAYAYLDNICIPCGSSGNEGSVTLNQIESDSCEIPGQICINYTLPSGNNPSLNVDLQLIQNGVIVNSITSPTFTSGNSFCFQLNSSNISGLNQSLTGFDYKIIGHPKLGSFSLTNIILGNTANGVKPGNNNDYFFICPDSSSTCCDIPNFSATLSENNGLLGLILNSGNVPIQEVEVSMVDYHAEYNEPDCQPVNMNGSGSNIGNLTTTTTNLNSLVLNASQNNSHVLTWLPGTPTIINNQISLSVTPPQVLNLICCNVNFWFCIKVRVKDINCNVCEKILCYPETTTSGCKCKGWSGQFAYVGINPQTPLSSRPAPVKCGDSIIFNEPESLHISIGDFICEPTTCHAIYKWSVQGPLTGSNTGKPFDFNFSLEGNYTVTITPYCGNKPCEPCIIHVIIKHNDCDCKGSGWMTDKPAVIKTPTGQVVGSVYCGGNITIQNTGTYQIIAPVYNCNLLNCIPTYIWTVQGQSGGTNQGNIFTYNFSTPGTYDVFVTPVCGGHRCEPCKYTIKIEGSPCSCGKWKNNTIKILSPTQPAIKFECNDTIRLNNTGTYFITAPDFVCIPDTCHTIYNWSVNGQLGGNWFGSNSFNFNFSLQGIYAVTITPNCGNQRCEPCRFTIIIGSTDCKCDKWITHTLSIQWQNPEILSKRAKGSAQDINIQWKESEVLNGTITCPSDKPFLIDVICLGHPVKGNFCQYICVPKDCQVKYNWEVIGPDNTQFAAENNSATTNFYFTPTKTGIYTLNITPVCDSTKCEDKCVIEILIKNIKDCKAN
jgi:hypothetical protein